MHPNRKSNTNRANVINHPTLRTLQRALAYNIFGRGETASNLNRRDTYFLFLMLNHGKEDVLRPNMAIHIIRHIVGVLNNPQTGGDISIGAFVTYLAHQLKVIDVTQPVFRTACIGGLEHSKTPTLNQRYFVNAGLLKEHNGVLFNFTCDNQRYPLPLPPIDPANPETWRGLPLQAVPPPPPIGEIPPVGEVPPQAGASSSQTYPGPSSYMDPNDPEMPNNRDLMAYLTSMERNNKERYDTLHGQYTTLGQNYNTLHGDYTTLNRHYTEMDNKWEAKYNDLFGNYTTMQESQTRLVKNNLELAANYGNLHQNYSILAKRVDEIGSTQNMRFDDLYRYGEHNLENSHNTYEITRQMANWNIRDNNMPEFNYTPYERMKTTYPYPTSDDEAGGSGGQGR
jgi:hypothetical protein